MRSATSMPSATMSTTAFDNRSSTSTAGWRATKAATISASTTAPKSTVAVTRNSPDG